MSVNLATFGGENKEYKIKSQPIDRFCLISLLYNWTYELMVSPTLYNLDQNKYVTLSVLIEIPLMISREDYIACKIGNQII